MEFNLSLSLFFLFATQVLTCTTWQESWAGEGLYVYIRQLCLPFVNILFYLVRWPAIDVKVGLYLCCFFTFPSDFNSFMPLLTNDFKALEIWQIMDFLGIFNKISEIRTRSVILASYRQLLKNIFMHRKISKMQMYLSFYNLEI